MSLSEKLKNMLWSLKRSKGAKSAIIVIIVIIGVTVGGYFVFKNSSPSSPETNSNTGESQSNLVPRQIDGVLVDPSLANYYPVAVMVENLAASRPASGLDKANLVWEALTEGGITRFMVIYASGDTIKEIGPVRSSRSYYLDWTKELSALYAHIGGSPDSLSLIKEIDINDLNQFWNSRYFWRAKDRPAPHNLFTSSELLAYALRDKNYPADASYEPWKFKDEAKAAERGTEKKTLKINFSTFSYLVQWEWSPEKNDYVRSVAGEVQKMKDGREVHAKNVVVQFVKTELADAGRLAMETVGSGVAKVYQDGKEIAGTWKKTSREDRTRFYTSENKEIEFNRGTTWIEVVPTDRDVTFQ